MSEEGEGDRNTGDIPDDPHPRAAKQKLATTLDYRVLLEAARRVKCDLDGDTGWLDRELEANRVLCNKLSQQAGLRIESRRRTPGVVASELTPPRPEYVMFVDECGSHTPHQGDPFPVFCVCGIIVDVERYQTFDRLWKTWKAHHLGSPHVRVHEPDVRKRSDKFYVADPDKERELFASLDAVLADLEFTCIAAVIDHRRFAERYPGGAIDPFLPRSFYLVCIDFLMERYTHFLYHAGNNAYGRVHAEARGLRENAEVQHEYLRLHLHGTQYISETQFRSHLQPSIQSDQKHTNNSGLQIADLLARPIAEKVLWPESEPERWKLVEPKLFDGLKGRPESYGLKVFPSSIADAEVGK